LGCFGKWQDADLPFQFVSWAHLLLMMAVRVLSFCLILWSSTRMFLGCDSSRKKISPHWSLRYILPFDIFRQVFSSIGRGRHQEP
jgi:hypothetical protein